MENQLLEVKSLGTSFLKRQIPLFVSRAIAPQRPHVLVIARCHCGETPGGFIIHGIIQFLLSDHEKAAFLRENVHFHFIPMLNVDGVVLGHYRGNGNGIDMNRGYSANQQSDILQPEVGCLKKYLQQFTQEREASSFEDSEINKLLHDLNYISGALKSNKYRENKLDIIIDLHSHSGLSNGLIFYNSVQNDTDEDQNISNEQQNIQNQQQPNESVDLRRDQAGMNFIRQLNKNCKTFQYYNDKNIPGSLRKGVFQSFFSRYKEGAPHIFGLEVSNSHGFDPELKGDGEIIDYDEIECYKEGEQQIQVQYIQDETALDGMKSYTPKDYIFMGHKILESVADVYLRANH